MPITVADVYAPVGLLDPSMFAGLTEEQRAARVTALVADATVLVPGATDDQIKAYVYADHFRRVLVRLVTSPNSISADDASRAYAADQRRILQGWLREYDAVWASALASVVALPTATRRATNVSAPTRVVW